VAVLAAFEAGCRWADGWVPDPLPAGPGDGPGAARARLVQAVGELNRRLPARTLRFEVVGDIALCDLVGLDGCEIDPADGREPVGVARPRPGHRPPQTNGKKSTDWDSHDQPVGAM
jgi:hypothetical protein